MTEKIAYEPHPVSPERKAELRAQGFKIIDERFKPADEGKLPEAEQHAALIAELQERGIEFDEAWPTDELRALSITPAQPQEPAGKRGRKPAQPQE
ncbi:HeH/LEM domain-containing protein [Comamonas sp. 4034]|uniref:HeH/LEM domain-containing protein n=1 Tax=Comamonas sp. 4034 TaxID=3156455 RepID=UPI003D1C43F8